MEGKEMEEFFKEQYGLSEKNFINRVKYAFKIMFGSLDDMTLILDNGNTIKQELKNKGRIDYHHGSVVMDIEQDRVIYIAITV